PDIDEGSLMVEGGHVIAPALAPIPDRGNIHGLQPGVAVVAPAGRTYQLAPVLQVERVGEIGLPNRLALGVGAARAAGSIPVRKRMALVVGHEACEKCLAVR